MTLVENETPPVPGFIVTGIPVVSVVVSPSLKDDSITCEIVVVYSDCTVVVINVVYVDVVLLPVP